LPQASANHDLRFLPVCVNPGSGFNCYWSMPFRKNAKVTMTNISDKTDDAVLSD
jgi:hypothetical protein